MIEVGRVCIKTAGRDAGKYCVVVDVKDRIAEVDGQTRRRKVNMAHLEPTKQKVEIKKGAAFADVQKALKALKIECKETKAKKAGPKPIMQRKGKKAKVEKKAKAPKTEKKAPAKEEAKTPAKPAHKEHAKKQ